MCKDGFYGQSCSGESFTSIGEKGHLGVLPMSLKYLLDNERVENIKLLSIEAYGIKAAKICFFDLVHPFRLSRKDKTFDPYRSQDNSRVNSNNTEMIDITHDNCLNIITQLQNVSHMAPTLENPHSSRGHILYLEHAKMLTSEAAGEGQAALGTKDEFADILKLVRSKGKLDLNAK